MAGRFLIHFVEMFDAYYGPRYMLMNQHMLLHLKKNVSDHGPLWCSSLFIFEDWNGASVIISMEHRTLQTR